MGIKGAQLYSVLRIRMIQLVFYYLLICERQWILTRRRNNSTRLFVVHNYIIKYVSRENRNNYGWHHIILYMLFIDECIYAYWLLQQLFGIAMLGSVETIISLKLRFQSFWLIVTSRREIQSWAMAKLAEIFLFSVAFITCVRSDEVQAKNENVVFWGDLSTKIILGISRAKTGFPLITRSFEVTYPEVFIYIAVWKYDFFFAP